MAAALVATGFAAPLGYLAWRTLGDPAAVLRTWTSARTLGPLGRSLLLTCTVTVAAATLGTALAWTVTRTDLPRRRLWQALLPLPLVIPSFIGAFTLMAAFAPGGLLAGPLAALGFTPSVRGFPAAFAVLTLFTYPYVYLPAAARLRALPASLEESARLLGRGPLHTFAGVVVPQVRPAVQAGAALVALYTLSDFGAVSLLRYDTLTRAIYTTRLFDRPTSLALSLLLAVLAITAVATERVLRRRGPSTPVKREGRPLRVPLGGWRVPALGLVVATLGVALAAPVTVLGYWATRGLSARPGAAAVVTDLSALVLPAANSARLGLLAAACAVVAVAPVAHLSMRHRSRGADLAAAVVTAGFALPGLVIALALVFWTLRGPAFAGAVYQTVPLLVFAYVVHFGAQALRATSVAVAGIPPGVEDAARLLGAGRVRRLLTVEAPLLAPGVAAGAGLVLLSTMKELPATLLLAPPGVQTLATKVWTATEDAFLADASLAALLLVAVSAALTWLLVIRHADTAD